MKIQITPGKIITTLLLTGFAACVALADTQGIKPTFGQGSTSCGGTYYAYARITNSSGTIWITPPAGITNGIFTDTSAFSTNYHSSVLVTRKKDLITWCGSNSVTFPATNSTSYQMIAYVTSQTPPPTNGQPLTLQIVWH